MSYPENSYALTVWLAEKVIENEKHEMQKAATTRHTREQLFEIYRQCRAIVFEKIQTEE